ncbi:DMT family transporter [Ahrensia kielensis]|uniref:DMT family transporter n=1 Tax=Ahrensia kielensis TaxID=76980 RepID=UPI00039AE9FE|nr:DMT family transporter [Ahrensia kielensis]
MQNNKNAYIFLFLTTLFWGGNAVAGKLAVGHVSPMMLTSIRWGVAVSLLLLIGGKQFWQDRAIIKPHLPLLFIYGGLGFAVFNVTMYSALNHTSAINVAIEQAAVPAVIFIGNFILFRMRVSALQIFGFSLSLIGVAVVASHGSLERLAALEINKGDMFMGIGVLAYAAYSVILRYKPDLHWKSLMTTMAIAAFIVSLPFAYFELKGPNAILPDAQGWAIGFYTAIFPAIIAQVLWIKGIDLIGANRAGVFINLVPIIGTILAVIILGEVFGLYHGIAMALVVGGIWIAESSGRKAHRNAPDVPR